MKVLTALDILIPTIFSAEKGDSIEDSAVKKSDVFSKSIEWVEKTWRSPPGSADGKTFTLASCNSCRYGNYSKTNVIVTNGLSNAKMTLREKGGKAKIEFLNVIYGASACGDDLLKRGHVKRKSLRTVEKKMDEEIILIIKNTKSIKRQL